MIMKNIRRKNFMIFLAGMILSVLQGLLLPFPIYLSILVSLIIGICIPIFQEENSSYKRGIYW